MGGFARSRWDAPFLSLVLLVAFLCAWPVRFLAMVSCELASCLCANACGT